MKHEILQVPCQRQITLIICFLCSYTNGKEAMEKFQFEKAVICFSKAITLQPEQVLG